MVIYGDAIRESVKNNVLNTLLTGNFFVALLREIPGGSMEEVTSPRTPVTLSKSSDIKVENEDAIIISISQEITDITHIGLFETPFGSSMLLAKRLDTPLDIPAHRNLFISPGDFRVFVE